MPKTITKKDNSMTFRSRISTVYDNPILTAFACIYPLIFMILSGFGWVTGWFDHGEYQDLKVGGLVFGSVITFIILVWYMADGDHFRL